MASLHHNKHQHRVHQVKRTRKHHAEAATSPAATSRTVSGAVSGAMWYESPVDGAGGVG